MSSHSQFIADRIQLFGNEKRQAAEAVWQHPRFRDLYPQVLLNTFDVIKASVHLIETGRAAAEAQADSDPVCAGLAPYFAVHREEEAGHELWVLEDLERLGTPRSETLERTPAGFAAALVGAQYYWVHHTHPISLLGYMCVLEWDQPDLTLFESISARSGLPVEAFSTFSRHAHLDQQHRADMEALADRLPLMDEHRRLLSLSILHASQGIAALYRGLLTTYESTLVGPTTGVLG